jgi:hypothetical protein
VASLLLVLVLATAVGTGLAVVDVRAAAARAAQREAADSNRVIATVLGPSDQADSTVTTAPTQLGFDAQLRWSWHGQVHTSDHTVSGDLEAGSVTTVWTDDSGRLVEQPLRGSDITLIVAGIALGGALLSTILALGAHRAYQAWAVRRRAQLWAGDWARVSALWRRPQGFY